METIAIQGTFDIARARATIRTHLAMLKMPPRFGARATLVMTALGEIIMAGGGSDSATIQFHITEKPQCIEIFATIHMKQSTEVKLINLKGNADILQIEEHKNCLYIKVYIGAEER